MMVYWPRFDQGTRRAPRLITRPHSGLWTHRTREKPLSIIFNPVSWLRSLLSCCSCCHTWDMSLTPTSSSSSSSSSQMSMFPAPRERGWHCLPAWAVLELQPCPSCQQHMCISPDSEGWPWGWQGCRWCGKSQTGCPALECWFPEKSTQSHSPRCFCGICLSFFRGSRPTFPGFYMVGMEYGPFPGLVIFLFFTTVPICKWGGFAHASAIQVDEHHQSTFLLLFFFLEKRVFWTEICSDLYLVFSWAVKIVNRIFITYFHQKTLANKGRFC